LGRDGWVDSERAGRISHYRLSPSGLARFTEATSRIYAPPRPSAVTAWALSSEGTPQTAVALGGLWLAPADTPQTPRPAFRLVGRLTDLAPAMRDSLISAEHATALRRLMTDLDRLDGLASDPLTHAAARILLIHRWRRIVLRYPDLPPEVLPADLASLAPRARVAAAYHHLSPGTEAWLDSAEGEIAAMPPADASLARRFRGA
jgi:phenylacetic acid degradation operon negative regulatory protein